MGTWNNCNWHPDLVVNPPHLPNFQNALNNAYLAYIFDFQIFDGFIKFTAEPHL
jgi:hypothetical protein